ncbi:MAG: DUF6152 family protein [Acidobacteriota bacterium]|nr:DUF6152 family protein [Acidobacteriota bacterium]
MKKIGLAMAGGIALLLAGMPAWAHHGFAAEFDIDKPVKVKGAVVKWELVNPHSWLQVDVKGDDGKLTTWRFEGPPPNTLFRLGFTKDSLPPGTEVIVEGYAAKDGSTRASGKNITFPDGRTLLLGLASGAPGAPEK